MRATPLGDPSPFEEPMSYCADDRKDAGFVPVVRGSEREYVSLEGKDTQWLGVRNDSCSGMA